MEYLTISWVFFLILFGLQILMDGSPMPLLYKLPLKLVVYNLKLSQIHEKKCRDHFMTNAKDMEFFRRNGKQSKILECERFVQ